MKRWALAVIFLAALAAEPAHPASKLPREIKGADGAKMVLVPGGEFIMGSPLGSYIFGDNEAPQRRVYLKTFYIDKYEVTNALFRKKLVPEQTYSGTFGNDKQPVVGVTWDQAKDYCERVGKRLPTEAEWEKAARGTDGQIFPWGNGPANCELAIMGETIPSCSRGYSTWEVGSRPKGASPYGAMDMAGNVMEWVADWYVGKYYAAAPDRNPKGPPEGSLRVLRGGAWFNSGALLRAAFRTGFEPDETNHGVGFRCTKSTSLGLVKAPGPRRYAASPRSRHSLTRIRVLKREKRLY